MLKQNLDLNKITYKSNCVILEVVIYFLASIHPSFFFSFLPFLEAAVWAKPHTPPNICIPKSFIPFSDVQQHMFFYQQDSGYYLGYSSWYILASKYRFLTEFWVTEDQYVNLPIINPHWQTEQLFYQLFEKPMNRWLLFDKAHYWHSPSRSLSWADAMAWTRRLEASAFPYVTCQSLKRLQDGCIYWPLPLCHLLKGDLLLLLPPACPPPHSASV